MCFLMMFGNEVSFLNFIIIIKNNKANFTDFCNIFFPKSNTFSPTTDPGVIKPGI